MRWRIAAAITLASLWSSASKYGAPPQSVLAATTPAASSWIMSSHDAQSSNFNGNEAVLGRQNVSQLRQEWLAPGITDAIATASHVYAIKDNRIIVIDARSGRTVRTFGQATLHLTQSRFSTSRDMPQTLAYADGRLIIGTTTEIIALNPETGHEYWRVPGGAYWLTISNGTIYTGKACGRQCGIEALFAIDITSGRVRWEQKSPGTRPVVIGDHLFEIAGSSGQAHIYDLRTGRLIGTWLLNASTFTGDATGVYTSVNSLGTAAKSATCHRWLGLLDASGQFLWKAIEPECPVTSSLVLAYHTLYTTSSQGNSNSVSAREAANGHQRWRTTIGADTIDGLAGANHVILALDRAAHVTMLDADSGSVLARLDLPIYSAERPALQSDQLMIAGGTLYVLDGRHLIALAPHVPAGPPTSRLAGVVIRLTDLRSGYRRVKWGYSDVPGLASVVPTSTLAAHGYRTSFNATFTANGTRAHATQSSVVESADQYRDAAGAHWEYQRLLQVMRNPSFGLPYDSDLRQTPITMPGIGNESAAFYALPPEQPSPEVSIVFRQGNIVVAVSGLGTASGRTWPESNPPVRRNTVLALASLINRRILNPKCGVQPCP